MSRHITIVSVNNVRNSVTIITQAPHGLIAGAVVYIEGFAPWNGWWNVSAVPSIKSFVFTNSNAKPVPAGTAIADGWQTGSSTAAAGNVGVLVDDVNSKLFSGADQDSRSGNPNVGNNRAFVIGRRTSEMGVDGNRYSRALQVSARHHMTLTCGTQTLDQEFTTKTLPFGDTHNEGIPADRSHPGQYAYPTVQWRNPGQSLIDPLTGIRSFRATAPGGVPSGVQNFQTALDLRSAWQNPSGVLTGSGAAFSGSCAGTCPLFLRADNLSLAGGATYAAEGNSLDWVTVTITNASTSNPSCQGDDCKIAACLTADGVSCVSGSVEATLNGTAATYTLGSRTTMDLWQTAGTPPISRVDASRATGTVNYSGATRQVTWVSGNNFNTKWTAGSRITVGGAEYTIASVTNETLLTLSSGPNSDLSSAAYSANNFGVLIWKKSATTDRINIGPTTFQYGYSQFPQWNSYSVNSCGPAVVVNGVTGYNCFIDRELYWVAQDGSDFRDLGQTGTSYWDDGRFSQGGICGQSATPSQFDPADGDTFYCIDQAVYFDSSWISILKAHYKGDHSSYTPGQLLPDCGLNGGKMPCLEITIMQPAKNLSISTIAPAFSHDYQVSGFTAAFWTFGGISSDGDLMIFARQGNQDTIGWEFILSLGDRTPTGTGPNSMRVVAAGSSYRTAPLSWCVLHATGVPQAGWALYATNDMTAYSTPSAAYAVTLTSAALNTTPGVPGGLNTCPANSLGVTGQVCTDITISGEPRRIADGAFLQNSQIGDLIKVDSEYMQIVAKSDAYHLTVKRGYLGSGVGSHSATTLPMSCGVINVEDARIGLWNYRADPYSTNSSHTTVTADPSVINGHGGGGPGVLINAGAAWYSIGQQLCPSDILGQFGMCYQVRLGTLANITTDPTIAVAQDPPFAGKLGTSGSDSHPGACANSWCLDGRPFLGNSIPLSPVVSGSSVKPYVNVGGQLWKTAAANTVLRRKHLTTIAMAGRNPLVDISGPGSSLGTGSADSYKYCVAAVAGECYPGASAGDLYVNAPYISVPYCYTPALARQSDDVNSICVADMGSAVGNLTQVLVVNNDVTGSGTRRLGPAYSRWNQYSVYWNAQGTPSESLMFSQVRWLDGVRHEDLVTVIPPIPAPDGVARTGFIPVQVTAAPPSGVSVDNVVVEFGYAENGDPSKYFCTSRQEACVAVNGSTSFDANNPFYYEQTESFSGTPCSGGCTISIPALSQHVVYYRVNFRNSSGQVVALGDAHTAIVP